MVIQPRVCRVVCRVSRRVAHCTHSDATVYQGAAGAALMFLRLWEADYELPDQTNALERAEEYIHIAHRLIEEKEKLDPCGPSFLFWVLRMEKAFMT